MRTESEREVVWQRRSRRAERRWLRRRLLNLFILWHLAAVAIWLAPGNSFLQGGNGIIRPYMTATGLMQGWTMFSPNPDNRDVYVEARITGADGQVRSWDFPRMATLDYASRYRLERYRKLVEVAHLDAASYLWPSLIRCAARANNTDPSHRPVSVTLVRHFRIVPPPGQSFPPYQTYAFCQMKIRPEDLR